MWLQIMKRKRISEKIMYDKTQEDRVDARGWMNIIGVFFGWFQIIPVALLDFFIHVYYIADE